MFAHNFRTPGIWYIVEFQEINAIDRNIKSNFSHNKKIMLVSLKQQQRLNGNSKNRHNCWMSNMKWLLGTFYRSKILTNKDDISRKRNDATVDEYLLHSSLVTLFSSSFSTYIHPLLYVSLLENISRISILGGLNLLFSQHFLYVIFLGAFPLFFRVLPSYGYIKGGIFVYMYYNFRISSTIAQVST